MIVEYKHIIYTSYILLKLLQFISSAKRINANLKEKENELESGA